MSQREAKVSQREPKGAKNEPEGDQNASKSNSSEKIMKMMEKGSLRVHFAGPFESHLMTTIIKPKSMQNRDCVADAFFGALWGGAGGAATTFLEAIFGTVVDQKRDF